MKKTLLPPLLLVALIALLGLACNFGAPRSPGTADGLDPIYTQAAQTVQAQITQTAQAVLPGTATAEVPTDFVETVPPTQTAAPSQTPPPADTAVPPSPTPLPSATNTQMPPTPTLQPCNRAELVADISVSDGTRFGPSASFTKTWRLKNTGSCIWTKKYNLVFVDGSLMDGNPVIPLPGRVHPGEAVDLSVNLRAPKKDGNYRGYWMLRSDTGEYFGVGRDGKTAFWVDIRVVAPPVLDYPYDFAGNLCSAEWRTGAGVINCSGSSDDPAGSVQYTNNPRLENGRREDESTLWMRPNQSSDGWISGTYPEYKVRAGDHFVADIGCLDGYNRCDVTFSLDYRINGGSSTNLGRWHEVYDGKITRVDVDLSALAGQKVQFILSVDNNGRASHAQAFWLVPSIREGGVVSTPPPAPSDQDKAVAAARQAIAAHLGIDVSKTSVTSVEARDWDNTCLGFEREDLLCSPSFVPGYLVMVKADGRDYEVHTNADGTFVLFRSR